MERVGGQVAGVAGQPSEVERQLLRGLVDYLRQKRPGLREEWAARITDAQLLRVMGAEEIFSEVTAVYDNYVNALETGSVEALRAYARDLSERIVRRGVETDEVLGTVLLLRDVLARALFVRHQGDPELLGRVLDVYEPAANRIAVIVGVSFVEERERVIREQQAAIRERAEMLHRLSSFMADASLALDAPGSLEEVLQLVAEHARELVAAERCRAEIRLPDGTTIDAHADTAPAAGTDTEAVSVAPADVAALYAAVAPGRRSLRMSSAELAAQPARRTLEGASHQLPAMRSWLVASLTAPDGKDLGLIQAFDKRDGEFTHLDEEVLVQLAHMAAAAVERAQRNAHQPQPGRGRQRAHIKAC
jgi:GAF domain